MAMCFINFLRDGAWRRFYYLSMCCPCTQTSEHDMKMVDDFQLKSKQWSYGKSFSR